MCLIKMWSDSVVCLMNSDLETFNSPVFYPASRSQAEMGHTCRGTINLATANIAVEDSCNFVISNGGAQTYHLKASSEVERQRWITALELAKAKAVDILVSGEKETKIVVHYGVHMTKINRECIITNRIA